MKKLFLSVFAFLTIALTCPLANGQNNIMSLPPNYLKNFQIFPLPQGPNPPIGYGAEGDYAGQTAKNSHIVIPDKNGDILFFIVDDTIYDGGGYFIGLFSVSSFLLKGATEMVVIPDPVNCHQYYIIAVGRQTYSGFSNKLPYLTKIDMSAENIYDPTRLGAIVPTYYNNALSIAGITPGFVYTGSKQGSCFIAASNLRSDNSRLVFISNGAGIYRYKIDISGFSYDNYFLAFDIGPNPNQIGVRGEMELIELSSGNYRIAVPYKYEKVVLPYITPATAIYTADLSSNGTLINGTNQTLIFDYSSTTPNFSCHHGLEFSPDGNTLYFTHDATSMYPNPIEFFDYSFPNSGVQPLNVSNAIDFQSSHIELGGDGKLYFATDDRLATLSNPNNPYSPIWNDNFMSISYYANYEGTPYTDYNLKSYVLPDQIDGMNYADHFTATPECCLAYTTFTTGTDNINHEQSGTQTWNTTTTGNNPFATDVITVKDELVIKNGADITANNLRFEFATDAKLVVERGAKFTINNCTLTVNTTCENAPMWNGIEVHGPTNNQQAGSTTTSAGRFIANSSTIEHSYYGVHNFATVKSGTPGQFLEDYNYNRGGVILANNTTFRNNHRGTVFFDFQNTNGINGIDDQSKFYNCTFKTDALLNKPNLTPTVIMAHLFGVQGVNFLGCDFKNTDPSIAAHERGSGIEANNCLLKVTSLTTGGLAVDRGKFTDLTRGIEAYSSIGSPRTTFVNNTDFNNVWRSIYLKSNELANITNNTFDVASDNAWNHGYGLYLDYCNRFKVENNNFTTTHNGFIGTYTWDSQQGANNNEIYRNTFSNFIIGSQAAGNNGNRSAINGGLGLEYRCNNYTSTINADIYVSSGWLKPFHGQCNVSLTAPSNNKFSYTAQFGDFLQDSSVDYLSYQHSIGANLAPRNGYFYAPNTNPTVCSDVYNASTSCPLKPSKTKLVLFDELAVEKNVVIGLTNDLAVGDAKALYEAIQNLPAGQVKNALMAASPYLSDEMLLAYLQNNPPNGHLQQVLLANSPLSEEVLAAVKLLNLPKGIKNQIIAAQVGTSAVQELKKEIAYHKNEVTKIQSEIIRFFLFDESVEERYKEAIGFIKQEGACSAKRCELIAFYTANKEYTNAQQELNEIAQQPENADFVKLYSNILQLEQATDGIEELKTNTAIKLPIIEVAEMPVRKQETAMAEVLLKQAKLRSYQEPIEELAVSSGLRLMNQHEETQNSSLITQHAITVYPNPTIGEVNITHNLNLENGKVNFKVYNMLGVEVLNENLTSTNNEVKINNLKSGVYFYTITQNNQTIKTDKLMVR